MPAQDPHTRNRAVVPLVVAAVAAVLAGLMALPLLGQDGEEQGSRAPVADVERDGVRPPLEDDPLAGLVRRDPQDPLALGDVDAPVVMIEYSDFQCPFCGKFARDTEPVLVERFVEDGTLRIEWRDFPYLGEESTTAARAGRAAAAQGQFWEFQDRVYADQPAPNTGAFTREHFLGIARELGLDLVRFRRDMDSTETTRAIQRDFAEGQRIGVTGTPAFLVNGRPIMGAQPTDVFVQAVQQAAEAQAAR